MTRVHVNQIVRDAQKIYARVCRGLGYDLSLEDPGDLQLLCEHAGDDEATVRRAVQICRDEGGLLFTGRSRELGYGSSSYAEPSECTEFETVDEADDDNDEFDY